MRWVVLVWLVATCLIATSSAACPPNTFTCADGSCIPSDWRGDGEKDCEDGSDEESSVVESTTDNGEDKFDKVVKSSSDGDCDWSQQQRIDNCSEPIIAFLHDIDHLNLKNMSFLTTPRIQSKIEEGCNMFANYQECIGSSERGCTPDEGVRSWGEVEVFLCQLVLPSVKEHAKCFESSADPRCSTNQKTSSASSTLCVLVNSIQTATSCVETIRPDSCSSDAIEMLSPIREETEHIVTAIRCVAPESEPESETTESESPSSPSTTLVLDETTESASSEDDLITTASQESSTTIPRENVENRPLLAINLADAVNSLYYIYDICSSNYSADPFAGVAEKICAKQDEIAKWSDCYQKTLEKEKCASKNATTSCEALISYNNNLDCAIVTMNDECDVDAQNLVVELQEEVNDLIIAGKCFEAKKDEATPAPKEGDFHLNTTLPKCTEEQENGALGCLVELVEINKKLTAFSNLNFLLEIASPNSTVVEGICQLFGRYEKCLETTIFQNGQRCSFASPLNSLARIGLAPICSLDSRPMLAKHRGCFEVLAKEADEETNCQSSLSSLSNTVSMMLQGVHGEALLCKSFYAIRDTFTCGEKAVTKKCEAGALVDLQILKNKMSALGIEEGCPNEPPANLEEIIARPVARPTPVTLPPRLSAPSARPMIIPTTRPTPTASTQCTPDEQKKFEECVKPLTAFQPHPLSVIAVPREIDQACEAFHTFKACSASSNCHPLWAKGMSAMFEYACNEASETFKKVRKCIRETSMMEEVRDCVSDFSRGAPTAACMSSNRLHACAVPHILEKCDQDAADWVSNYIIRFANAIDARCRVGRQLPVGKVVGIGCSVEEESIIEHCAAPLNDIGSRVEELFAGGMQSLIKNINSLAPVFAGGCNLTEEFRTCAHFLLEGRTSCVVSSCMIEAGRDICMLPDPTKAIDDNLSCLFGQAQEPKFAQCIRSTISTLKKFNLATLRSVLPKFIDCTKDIVLEKCGESPIKILKAMSTPDICPIKPQNKAIVPINVPTPVETPKVVQPSLTTVLSTVPTQTSSTATLSPITVSSEFEAEPSSSTVSGECSETDLVDHLQCETHLDHFGFRPISIIEDGSMWTDFCTMVNQTYLPCVDSLKCKFEPASNAQVTLIDSICNREITLRDQKQFANCLSSYTKTPEGKRCTAPFSQINQLDKTAPEMMCDGINKVMTCSSAAIEKECGFDAVLHVFSIHMHWANLFNPSCILESPEPTDNTKINANEVEPSRDTRPEVVQKDETTPSTTTSVSEESNDITESVPVQSGSISSILASMCILIVARILF